MGADAVVIRHPASGAPHRLADWVSGSVVNAGDGTHEHPTQALLDAFTMRQRLVGGTASGGRGQGLDGLRVTIVGDVLHTRVARSNVLLLCTLGAAGDAGRPADADAVRGRDAGRARSATTSTRSCARPTW